MTDVEANFLKSQDLQCIDICHNLFLGEEAEPGLHLKSPKLPGPDGLLVWIVFMHMHSLGEMSVILKANTCIGKRDSLRRKDLSACHLWLIW